MSVETSPPTYTASQSEVIRLYDLYRRCLLDQKYYAFQLSRYRFWDGLTNLIAAMATLLSVSALSFWKTEWGQPWFSAIGLTSALVLVIRPLFRPSENIERYTRLHYGFTELFYQIESLLADIRRHDSIKEHHRHDTEAIVERFKNLAIQEDPSTNLKLVERFQSEVEKAIPETSLWLPGT